MSWTKILDDPDSRLTFSDCVDLENEMERNKIVLSGKDAELLINLLENPPEPSEALKRLVRAHKKHIKS